MAQYRKKPIMVEAEQWWPDGPKIDGLHWCGVGVGGKATKEEIDAAMATVEHFDWPRIQTLGGEVIVSPGDWIIKGEHYPIKDEIFRETYDLVTA